MIKYDVRFCSVPTSVIALTLASLLIKKKNVDRLIERLSQISQKPNHLFKEYTP